MKPYTREISETRTSLLFQPLPYYILFTITGLFTGRMRYYLKKMDKEDNVMLYVNFDYNTYVNYKFNKLDICTVAIMGNIDLHLVKLPATY